MRLNEPLLLEGVRELLLLRKHDSAKDGVARMCAENSLKKTRQAIGMLNGLLEGIQPDGKPSLVRVELTIYRQNLSASEGDDSVLCGMSCRSL